MSETATRHLSIINHAMDIQGKLNEELFRELQKLRQENNILKALCDKDNSEHKQAEEVLKQSEYRLNAILSSMNDVIFEIDSNNCFEGYFAPKNKTLYVQPDLFIGKKFDEVLPEDVCLLLHQAIESINSGNPFQQFEYHLPIDNTSLWEHAVVTPRFNISNEYIGITAVCRDITDRKRIEEDLLKNYKRLELAMQTANMAWWEMDIASGNVTFNSRKTEMLGYNPEKFKHYKDFMALVHPEDYEKAMDAMRKHISGLAVSYEVEYQILTKSGQYKWFYDIGSIVENDLNGKPKTVTGLVLDISNRKKAEEAIESLNLKNELILNSAAEGILGLDLQGNHTFVNPAAAKMLGYKVEELLGRPCQGLWHHTRADGTPYPEDDCPLLTVALNGVEHRESNDMFWRKDSTGFPAEYVSRPIFEQGRVTGVVVTFSDITERKMAEDLLTESELKYRSLIESSSDAIFCIDEKGQYQFVNHHFSSVFGKTPDYFTGRTIWDLYDKEFADKRYELTKRLFKFGISESIEVELPLPDKTLYFWATTNPIKDKAGKVILNLTHATDITELKKTQIELIKAKVKAEESDRLKSAFLANMSHEIRTPMNGILGFAELLKKPGLSGETQKAYIKIIERSGGRMLNIINDIINISKIEAGMEELVVQKKNINHHIKDIYWFFKPQTEAKKIKLSYIHSLPANEATLSTDHEKLYAILTNLVKNAIKFTHKGSIEFGYVSTVSTFQAPDEMASESPELRFFVKDTGIGIAKDRQEAIFERFIQADIEDKMASQGAGLGLSISKAYVEMLGGKIWLESKEGKGSTFYFTLPYRVEPDSETFDC
jgi:PAS domain S-box-containing protein